MPRQEAFPAAGVLFVLGGGGGGDAIHHHGHQRDHDTGQQALAELCLAHGGQDLPADIGGAADDRGDDHHRERGHGGLVHAEHDLSRRAGHADAPEKLDRRGAGHQSGLDNLGRYAPEPEKRVPHRRREGIEHAGDQPHDGPEAEQQQDRQQIGEGRHRLHQIQGRCDDPLRTLRVKGQRAEPEADGHRRRHRDRDQGKRIHRLAPVADDHHVEDRKEGERRQPPARDGIGREGQQGQRDRPGQPVQQVAYGLHRHFDRCRYGPERHAERLHAPGHEHVEPGRDRHDPLGRVFDQPADGVAIRQQNQGQQDEAGRNPVESAAPCQPQQAKSSADHDDAPRVAHRPR